MVWLMIIGIIGLFIFSKYASDKSSLRTSVILKGGLDQVFGDFVHCINTDFTESKIVKMTETELEIFTLSADRQNFVFGIKLGFGGKANFRCDPQRSNFLNADIAVDGNISNQVQSYKMIVKELVRKYKVENKVTSENLLEEVKKFVPPDEEYYIPQAIDKKLDFYGFYYQNIIYYSYNEGQTTYLKFNHNDQCIVLLANGVPNYKMVLFGVKFGNNNCPMGFCNKISDKLMRFTIRHGEHNHIYEIHQKNPDILRITRQKAGTTNITHLEFQFAF